VPAVSWILSLLALKLTRTRRVSHVDDLLLSDPAAALFAGLSTLPKKSALTDYSYATTHDHQRRFLAGLDTNMISSGVAGLMLDSGSGWRSSRPKPSSVRNAV
jgi:hypothetical protein